MKEVFFKIFIILLIVTEVYSIYAIFTLPLLEATIALFYCLMSPFIAVIAAEKTIWKTEGIKK